MKGNGTGPVGQPDFLTCHRRPLFSRGDAGAWERGHPSFSPAPAAVRSSHVRKRGMFPFLPFTPKGDPMPQVIVLDELSPDGLRLLERAENIEHEVRTGLKVQNSAKPCSISTVPSVAVV